MGHAFDLEAASSLFPFAITITFLVASTIVIVVKGFLTLHAYSHPSSRRPSIPRVEPRFESDGLLPELERLEKANAMERDLHGRTLRKITELQSELDTLRQRNAELTRLLEIETQSRLRLQERSEKLESRPKSSTIEDILRDFPSQVASYPENDPHVGDIEKLRELLRLAQAKMSELEKN